MLCYDTKTNCSDVDATITTATLLELSIKRLLDLQIPLIIIIDFESFTQAQLSA